MRSSAALPALVMAAALAWLAPAPSMAAPVAPGALEDAAAMAIHQPLDAVTAQVDHAHPIAMFYLAKRLFDVGRKDEGVFWFYESQLRWRPYLSLNPQVGEKERFQRLFQTIGPDINRYAFSDIPALAKIFDGVLAWDAAHPDDFTPAGPAKEASRKDLEAFRAYILARQDEIKKQRAEEFGRRAPESTPDDPYGGSGGAGLPPEMVPAYEPARFASFHVGVTRKSEVVQALGRPEWWSSEPDGTSEVGYTYVVKGRTLAIIGMAQVVRVSFRFDARKILTAIDLPKDPLP